MRKIILVTGTSNGFGLLASNALAQAGHTVYASMRETTGRNASRVAEVKAFAGQHNVDLRAIEIDVASQASVDAAIGGIISDHGRLDAVVHSSGRVAYGPAEAFTPEQLAELFDTNVVSTQRVNRAALPQLRKQGQGLVVWVSSSGTRGGTPPYLGPYFASKAAMEALAISYAGELARWGIETTIIVPGSFNKGTNLYAHSGRPADAVRAEEYADGPTADITEIALKGLAALEPRDADPQGVADVIVEVVDTPLGQRPFRVHFDPSDDGALLVNGVADRVRAELLRRIGLGDLLKPAIIG
jgi:NAD(P)-dependent dehydrogenase (short-subunit alcohol dehydrogenase family)